MILINKCFEVITEESAEQGDFTNNGFEYEDQAFSFRDLISEMEEYSETSSYPAQTGNWLISEPHHNYSTGEETSYSLHYSRDNKPRCAKYWEKAMRVSGFIKERK